MVVLGYQLVVPGTAWISVYLLETTLLAGSAYWKLDYWLETYLLVGITGLDISILVGSTAWKLAYPLVVLPGN